jgi:anhydro-N-acetylmuramic acid kinase
LKLRNEVNCLQSVTGASQDHSSGEIYLPTKY